MGAARYDPHFFFISPAICSNGPKGQGFTVHLGN